jgi:Toprim domain
MSETATDLARQLARNAERVCRHYLSNGRREGRTWRVGDADNTPGRSLMVRLVGPDSGKGAAGHWVDFATGEHGDLLDLIARTCRLDAFRNVLDEARRFLNLPQSDAQSSEAKKPLVPRASPEAARRLFASAKPIRGTIAEIYLRNRGITDVRGLNPLRFHPRCYYRAHDEAPREIWPALLTGVTDLNGIVTGVLRTWLERDGSDKAPLATPRRAMGHLLGHGARFGMVTDVVAAGEGIETILALREVLPAMPMVAALSASHLGALILPPGLRRLYIARDNDRTGHRAMVALSARATANAIESFVLTPLTDDFNSDLCTLGTEVMAASLRVQLVPDDVGRFLCVEHRPGPRLRQRSLSSGASSLPAAPGLQEGDRARSG